MTLDEYNAQPGMVTASEWCALNGTTMREVAEAQEYAEHVDRVLCGEEPLWPDEVLRDGKVVLIRR